MKSRNDGASTQSHSEAGFTSPEVQDLRARTAEKEDVITKELGIKFLLDEFKELGKFWRHADSRVESAINLYLTGGTIIVSAVVVLSQRIADLNVFMAVSIFVAVGLAAAGSALARRIIGAEIIKAEYIYALELIRRYFVDNAEEIAPYLVLPFADSPVVASDVHVRFRVSASQLLLTGVSLWAGFLLGFAVAAILWLLLPSSGLLVVIGVGIIVGTLATAVLNLTLKEEVRHHTAALEKRYRGRHKTH